MKVVSKGFEGAMMLGAKKIDRSKISVFDAKTAKNWEICGELWCAIFGAFLAHFQRMINEMIQKSTRLVKNNLKNI